MSQPTDANNMSMDLVYEGQPWVTRIPKTKVNTLNMDSVYEGQPWVLWGPDQAKQKVRIIPFIWGN